MLRVLVEGKAPGTRNMERDLELLREGVPTVRLYGWEPACVSLGLPQPESDVDADAARGMSLDVVRRPTGGGAILHAEDEVTYCVVLPRDRAPGGLFESYRLIARGVMNALERFGLEGHFMEGHTGRQPLCYMREEGVSVGVGGRKISGGAQKRTRDGILQHGTLLVSTDVERNARLFRTTPAEVQRHMTSLRDLGIYPTRSEVTAALVHGFTRALAGVVAGPPIQPPVPAVGGIDGPTAP